MAFCAAIIAIAITRAPIAECSSRCIRAPQAGRLPGITPHKINLAAAYLCLSAALLVGGSGFKYRFQISLDNE